MKTNANIFSTTCQEMSDSRKYWWLSISSRKRLPCFVELLEIPETESREILSQCQYQRQTRVAENKVGFYVLARGRLCKYFYWCFTSLGSRAGFNLNYWKIVGSGCAASLCLGKEHSELRPGRSGLCLGKCPGRRTQKHGAIQGRGKEENQVSVNVKSEL